MQAMERVKQKYYLGILARFAFYCFTCSKENANLVFKYIKYKYSYLKIIKIANWCVEWVKC